VTLQGYEEYRITVEIVFSDGSVLDVTDYVKEIQIAYSLNLAVPEVAIIFQRPITRLEQSIEVVNLKIETYKHTGSILHTDRYKLVPTQTQHVVDAPLQRVQEALRQEGFNTSDRIVLFFYIKSVYDTVNYTVGPLIKFNTTLESVLNEILPDNCEIQLQSELELDKFLPQVFIKRQPFLSALNYLKYWYGLSKGPVCTVVVPKLDDTEDVDKTVLLLDDINASLTQVEMYRLELVVRMPGKEVEQDLIQEYEGTKFVIDYPIHFSTNVVNPVEYTFVIKPYRKLYQKLVLDETQLINQYGAANKGYFPEVENLLGYQLREKRLVNNHTGFDESFSPLTSMFAYEYMFNVRGLIRLGSIPTFRALWPSDHVKLTIQNPEFSEHSGLYIVESVLYRLTREESKEWQLGVELSVVRSNAYYQQVPYTEGEEQPGTTIRAPELSSISSEVTQLDQQTQNVASATQEATARLSEYRNNVDTYNAKVNELESLNQNVDSTLDSIQSSFDQIMEATSLDECNTYLDNILNYVNNVTNIINQISDRISEIRSTVDNITWSFQNLLLSIENLVQQVTDVRVPTLERVSQEMQKFTNNYTGFLVSSVTSAVDAIRNTVDSLISTPSSYVEGVRNTIYSTLDSFQRTYDYIQSQVTDIQSEVTEWKTLIEQELLDLAGLKQRVSSLQNRLDLDLDINITVCIDCGNILSEVHTRVSTNLDSIDSNIQNLSQGLISRVKELCEY